MYLLKTIDTCPLTESTLIRDGIRVSKTQHFHSPIATHEFWGKTKIHLGTFAEISRFPKINENEFYLTYINEFFVTDIGDNFKEFEFNVSTYMEKNLKGYIIFIKPGLDMKTNGTKLFGRYPDELVVLLKDGEFLEFNNKKAEVVNNLFVVTA